GLPLRVRRRLRSGGRRRRDHPEVAAAAILGDRRRDGQDRQQHEDEVEPQREHRPWRRAMLSVRPCISMTSPMIVDSLPATAVKTAREIAAPIAPPREEAIL